MIWRIKSVLRLQVEFNLTSMKYCLVDEMLISAVERVVDPLTEKLIVLFGTIIAIMYSGLCAFQFAELMFSSMYIDLWTSFYVIVITMSTVS